MATLVFGCASKDLSPDAFKNMSDRRILNGGEEELANHNYQDAVKYFEALDALYPFGDVTRQGQLDVIYAYYQSGDYASALAAADRYIHLYPAGPYTDYAYYMKGLTNSSRDRSWVQKMYTKNSEQLDLSNFSQAFIDFGTLIKLFPHSVYAKDAHRRMLMIRDLLAEHEMIVANFYFDREAYVAAANRASFVVKHFQGSPQVVPALKLMMKSYRALGLKKQESDTLRTLRSNYPREQV